MYYRILSYAGPTLTLVRTLLYSTMFGPLTVGKKAAKFGYKRFGIPGAVVSGSAGLIGYIAVRRAVKSVVKGKDVDTAIDTKTIRSAVDENGLDAVTDTETLEAAIDEDELGSDIDIDDVQSATEAEADELQNDTEDVDSDESNESAT
ncbi:hypothetical protein [Haladaptatus caseinilyticus]|uniref:hypothetical protein n=1 Tax=Haladaptatus caseinilyticus TaxID=2993314 RepID=UPI002E23E5AA